MLLPHCCLRLSFASTVAAAAVGCGGGGELTVPPTTGTVVITTSTSGGSPDADGYSVQMDAEPARAIGAAETLTSTQVTPGNHTVHLREVAANCAVSGDNPRTISVTAGETTTINFAVTCNQASTTTTIISDNPDPSVPNQPVTVTYRVDWTASAGTATGRVDVAVTDGGGARCDGPIDASGNGSCVLTDLMGTGLRTMAATYRGDDLFAGSTSAEVTHTVNEAPPPVGAPTANPDLYTVSQGNSFTTDGTNGLLFNDRDPDNDDMFVDSHTEPSYGTLTNFMDNGTFTYTVTDPTATADGFTYTIRDENGNVGNSTTVTITITP
jgi:Big-like domain-containing protein